MADYVFDLESDGFLGKMTRIHVLVIRDFQTRETWIYRHNAAENNIEEGVTRLMTADRLIGQNIIRFDIPAIKKIFPWFKHDAEILDTLVLCRVAAPDIKRSDIALWKKGLLPGELVGSHSLDAWGIRLGKFKGDYSKQMKAQGLDPWAKWNQAMEDYCVNDVDVTEVLYHQLCSQDINVTTSNLEHEVHDVANDMETHGFPFDIAAAQALAAKLQSEIEDLRQKVVVEYGAKFVPEKRVQIAAYWYDPDGVNLKKERQGKYAMPNTVWGEDKSRKWWGEITVPKMNRTVTKPEYPSPVQFTKDAAYCRAKWIDFNPTSRVQVIDRLVTEHDWTPVDFTENGGPSLDAAVLETLVERVPAAKTIGELFFLQKLHGQIATGPKSWINSYNTDTGCVHTYTDTGGTVTGRCAHSNPNIGQVPAVMLGKDKKPKLGREGEYGWECRSLFHVPPHWRQVGVDLSGIEFRCLANLTSEFDGGELINVVLTGDIHQFNMDKTGIPSRDIVKRILYACVPMDTQALTRRGWKRHDELIIGEDIMTYNADKKVKEWQPLIEVVRYDDAPLIEMSTDHSFKVVSTPNHRWFTKRRTGRNTHYYVDEVTTTEELTSEHAIIVNAPMSGDTLSYGPSDFLLKEKYGTVWTDVVLGMNQSERNAFLTGFCIADGHWKPSKDGKKPGRWAWCQNIGPLSEAALLASYLCTDKKLFVSDRSNTPTPMIVVKHGVNNNVTGQRLKKRVLPNAPVWCVRTANQSWVMRQGNVITITGNTLYGAGDMKLGLTAKPTAAPAEALQIGARLRAQLMAGLPALKKAIDKIKAQASHGKLIGLDGRVLSVRSEHSALNTRLQSDAALIAKKWLCLIRERAMDNGWQMGWNDGTYDGDLVLMAFVHDEIQAAVAPDYVDEYRALAIKAAADAGTFFNFRCPVGAEAKVGQNWAETH